MIMGGLLVVILVGYDAHPQWDYQYKSKYDNGGLVSYFHSRTIEPLRARELSLLTAAVVGRPQPRSWTST